MTKSTENDPALNKIYFSEMSDFETDAEDEPASPGEHECTMYTCITVCCGVGHMSSLVDAAGTTHTETRRRALVHYSCMDEQGTAEN